MKVHTTETQPQFKPITLHIEIESQKELDILRRLFGHATAVPRFLYEDTNTIDYTCMSDMMAAIYYELGSKP